ncbi:MAG: hypothetical protein FJW69_10520, partial [Actinobacteria bacterium]|nr:hypothetical protein [Actinomycetota bacterium]
MKKRLTDRWSIIKRSRANIALLAAGCLLVLLSPIWRFAIAPAVKVVANDYDELYFYEGNMTTFVNAPSLPALPGGRPL